MAEQLGRTARYYKYGSTVPGKRNTKRAKRARNKKKQYQKDYDATERQKKRRAELMRLNRQLGSKKGDGLDVSHQKDGSVKLEKASKNRGNKDNTIGDKKARGNG